MTISGVAILLAHPRLYWGETGSLGTASLIDLPLPLVLVGQTGWGRSLHFLGAWICVINGLFYAVLGLLTGHFRRNLDGYRPLQRRVYLIVIFALLPLMIWTGLAMSPGLVSVFPILVTALGGQQTARTIHFFGASLLVVFLVVHIAMVWRAGFAAHMRAMIAGGKGSG